MSGSTAIEVVVPGDELPTSAPLVFVAGPVSGCRPWRPQALGLLRSSLAEGAVADPSPVLEDPRVADGERAAWEAQAMEAAARGGCLLFWIPRQDEHTSPKRGFPKPYAAATRFELGVWLGRRVHDPTLEVVVGIDEHLGGAGYLVEQVQACSDVEVVPSLDVACERAAEIVRRQRPV